jgi:hypothetical protein
MCTKWRLSKVKMLLLEQGYATRTSKAANMSA